jgi:hypothetical protein
MVWYAALIFLSNWLYTSRFSAFAAMLALYYSSKLISFSITVVIVFSVVIRISRSCEANLEGCGT